MSDYGRHRFSEYQTAIALATLHCAIDYDATASDSEVEAVLSPLIAEAANPARAAGVLFALLLAR
jgi:hypothetical protein